MAEDNDYSLLGLPSLDKLSYDKEGVLDVAFGNTYRELHEKQKAYTPNYMATMPIIEKLFKVIVDECIEKGTGDVQITQVNDKLGYVRIKDGVDSKVIRIIDVDAIKGLLAHIKLRGSMNVDEQNKPQDGRITYTYEDKKTGVSKTWNIRVNIIRDVHSEAIAMRLLKADNSDDDVSKLNMPDMVMIKLRRVLGQKEGMLLLTGATGSGKPLADNTLIPYYDNNQLKYKQIKDLNVGDAVYNEYGELCKVIGVYPQELEDKSYKLKFSDNSEVVCGKNHEWVTQTLSDIKNNREVLKGIKDNEYITEKDIQYMSLNVKSVGITDTVNTDDLHTILSDSLIELLKKDNEIKEIEKGKYSKLELLSYIYKKRYNTNKMYETLITTEGIINTLKVDGKFNHSIPVVKPIHFNKEAIGTLKVKPYIVGVFWALNMMNNFNLKIMDEDLNILNLCLNENGYKVYLDNNNKYDINKDNISSHELEIFNEIKRDNLPQEYRVSGIMERYEFIKGVNDILGVLDDSGYINIFIEDEEFILELKTILSSLGIVSEIGNKSIRYKLELDKGFLNINKYIKHKEIIENIKGYKVDDRIFIVGYEELESVPMTCIEVDSKSNLYLFGTSFISTHNTTTMYTSLREIMRTTNNQRNIFTIEDPVEYIIPGVTQIPVDENAGRSYQEGIRALLRQNPDIVLIGEIRDNASAQTALRAATSGHLLLSTLHANNALQVPIVLERYGVNKHEITSALQMVINQRLEKKLCDSCKLNRMLTPKERGFLREIENDEPMVMAYEPNPEGCINCHYTGYSGKVLLVEMLDADKKFDIALNSTDGEYELRKELLDTKSESYYPMKKDVVRQLKLGHITMDTAMDIVRK